MTTPRFRRLSELFALALERPAEERDLFLDEACGGDSELRRELAELLAADRPTDGGDRLRSAVREAAQAAADVAGRRLGPWELQEEIGHGGMGTVYRARRADEAYQQAVAIKVLRGLPSGRSRERFLAERQILADLRHPGIARLLDGGATEDGLPYLVMELVEGEPIDAYCRSRGLSIEARLRLFLDASQAVAEAHRQLVIHRDLKPGNILVTADGRTKLLDFGVAKLIEPGGPGLTTEGTPLTPAYSSPEQLRGEPVTVATDVYALGLLLYELLTGQRAQPVGVGSPAELVAAICERPPRRPSALVRRAPGSEPKAADQLARRLAGDLDAIVGKALEKEPRRRYASVRELADDVERHLSRRPVLARPASLGYVAGRWARRRWRALVPAAAMALVLASLAGLWLRERGAARSRAEAARELGARAEQIATRLRIEHLAPAHDVAPARRAVAADMEEIRRLGARLGRAAAGPTAYALGRGHLELSQWDEARRQLERAWEEGFRTPEVAGALGLVLGELYLKGRLEMEAIPRGPRREARGRELDESLRRRAIELLGSARLAGVEGSAYVAGRLALYRGDFDAAVAAAGEALAAEPWLHEAELLRGTAHVEAADLERDAGRYDEAGKEYARAREAFAAAASIARSDPRPQVRLCDLASRRMQAAVLAGRDPRPLAEEAEAPCRAAAALDSQEAQSLASLAGLTRLQVEDLLRRGEDPRPPLARTLELARESLARRQNGAAHNEVGVAHMHLAEWEMQRGGDPRPHFDEAIASLERARAFEVEPFAVNLHLGNAWSLHGEWLMARGEDPRESFERSSEALERAIGLVPDQTIVHNSLCVTRRLLGLEQERRGGDGALVLEAAVAACSRAVELVASNDLARSNLGACLLDLGQIRLRRGTGGEEGLLAQADEALAIAGRRPGYASPWRLRSALEVERAWLAFRRREDPAPDLDRARAAAEEALRRSPTHTGSLRRALDVELAAGELALERAAGLGSGATGATQAALARALPAARRGLAALRAAGGGSQSRGLDDLRLAVLEARRGSFAGERSERPWEEAHAAWAKEPADPPDLARDLLALEIQRGRLAARGVRRGDGRAVPAAGAAAGEAADGPAAAPSTLAAEAAKLARVVGARWPAYPEVRAFAAALRLLAARSGGGDDPEAAAEIAEVERRHPTLALRPRAWLAAGRGGS